MGPGWRKINSNVLGELDVRLILEQLTDTGRATRGSAGWGGDRWMLLEKDGQQALVIKRCGTPRTTRATSSIRSDWPCATGSAGAKEEEASTTRQALTAPTNATEVRRKGQTVVAVISFDRPSAEALANAVPLS